MNFLLDQGLNEEKKRLKDSVSRQRDMPSALSIVNGRGWSKRLQVHSIAVAFSRSKMVWCRKQQFQAKNNLDGFCAMLCLVSWHYSEMINTESQRWSIQRSSRWGTNQNGYSLGWGLVLAYLGPTWWILGGSFGTTCSTVITLAPLGGLLVTKVISHYLLAECDSAYICRS